MIAPIVQHILLNIGYGLIWQFNLLEWVLIYFAIIGNITAVQRFFTTLKWFNNKDSDKK